MILEVLVSTMNRKDISFINEMFIHCNMNDFKILIINQTDSGTLLKSTIKNIRVINSFEYGLSRSRNLAIENTVGDVCLIADDDVVYEKGFHKIILQAFTQSSNADLITFKAKNFKGFSYRKYKSCSIRHTLKTIRGVISFEIAFNSKKIKALNSEFDLRFGLGSEFPTGEEYLFSREVVKKGLVSQFCNEFIVSHPDFNSGMDLGSDIIVYARAALNYKLYGVLAYLWIPKYIFFLVRHKYIKPKDVLKKGKVSLSGIKAFRLE